MIARLASAGASSTVLLREAARMARRWQTYATRAIFSATLMGLVLAGIWFATQAPGKLDFVDAADLGWLGRGMFIAFATVQVLLAFVFSPLLVARALIEERDDRTIELLLLTRLTAGEILLGKVASRVLVLSTVILGALPVMALVVSLGGVSVIEVVALTIHTLIAVVVLGALGGFFSLFTRSPVIATIAGVFYTLPTFIVMPWIYAMLVAEPGGVSHISPLFGFLSHDVWSLLPALGFAPVVWLIFRIGAPLFSLRVSGARLGRLFRGDLWATPGLTWIGILMAIHTFSAMPAGVVGCWIYAFGTGLKGSSTLHVFLHGASVAAVWVWFIGLIYLGTWVYMRVAMDMVMVVDSYMGQGGGRPGRGRRNPIIRGNPVLWRESRPQAWRVVVPGLIGWFIALLVIFQTGLWVIPGGLLTLGAGSAMAALLLTVWLATAAVERERHDGTLEVLLGTTMWSSSIVVGKLVGVLLPTFPLLLLSFPMIFLGVPHLELFLHLGKHDMGASLLRGLGICLWMIPLHALVAVAAMVVALRVPQSRNAYGANMGLAVVFVVVPPLLTLLFPRFDFIRMPARVWMPVLSPGATWWELGLSSVGMASLAFALFVLLVLRLRPWGLRHG